MKHAFTPRRLWLTAVLGLVLFSFSGCADNDPSAVSNNTGVENPAAAAPNSIMPGVGIPGNGGGVTGGGTAPGHE